MRGRWKRQLASTGCRLGRTVMKKEACRGGQFVLARGRKAPPYGGGPLFPGPRWQGVENGRSCHPGQGEKFKQIFPPNPPISLTPIGGVFKSGRFWVVVYFGSTVSGKQSSGIDFIVFFFAFSSAKKSFPSKAASCLLGPRLRLFSSSFMQPPPGYPPRPLVSQAPRMCQIPKTP